MWIGSAKSAVCSSFAFYVDVMCGVEVRVKNRGPKALTLAVTPPNPTVSYTLLVSLGPDSRAE